MGWIYCKWEGKAIKLLSAQREVYVIINYFEEIKCVLLIIGLLHINVAKSRQKGLETFAWSSY